MNVTRAVAPPKPQAPRLHCHGVEHQHKRTSQEHSHYLKSSTKESTNERHESSRTTYAANLSLAFPWSQMPTRPNKKEQKRTKKNKKEQK
jgi:hypothetical protein